MSYGNRWDQAKAAERHGTDGFGQASDGTGTLNHLAKYNANGSVTDSTLLASDVVTSPGGGQGLTAGGYGSWYGQVPRGVVNGSNRVFLIDYKLLNPFTVLQIGNIQMPSVQGLPDGTVGDAALAAVPGGEYSIVDWTLTVATPPQPGERFYIEYFRADPGSVSTGVTLTVTSAYTPDPTADPSANISIYGTSFSFGMLPQKSSNTGWAKTTDTWDVTATLLPTQLTSLTGIDELSIYFFTQFGSNGTGFNSYLDIYDIFLTVTYADLSTAIFRPTNFTIPDNSSIAQMLDVPPTSANAYAIDGDPNTYARYDAKAWGPLASPTAFIVGGFSPSGSTPAPTPIAPQLPDVTSQPGDYTLPATLAGQTIKFTGSSPSTFTLPTPVSVPSAPVLSQVAGGALAARTEYVTITYTTADGETTASVEASLAISVNNLLSVASPVGATGVTGWNVYSSTTSGKETKQNVSAIPIGTDWTEPTTGLVTSGPVAPIVNTASPSSTYSATIVNLGTASVSLAPPTGTTLNGSTSPVSLAPGQAATVYFNPSTGSYTVPVASTSPGISDGGFTVNGPATVTVNGTAVSYNDTISVNGTRL